MNIFRNYKLQKNITSYKASNTFSQVVSFNYICSAGIGYFVLDYSKKLVVKFDKNFNLKNSVVLAQPKTIISINNSNNSELIITTIRSVNKFNTNMNQTQQYYDDGARYEGIYYNKTGDYFLVCSDKNNRIDVLTRDGLNPLKNIIVPNSPFQIIEYNNTLYVTSTLGRIMILKDEAFNSGIQTVCSSIDSFAINKHGEIAVLCSSDVYVYSTNGTYLGVNWTSPIENTTSIGFDGSGNFILTAYSGVYIFY